MRPLVAGNWKMNGLASSLGELSRLKEALAARAPAYDVLVCPPVTLLSRAVDAAAGAFAVGAQDCHALPGGAYTGDISAEMLRDSGASFVIVGHSERRQLHGERDGDVAAKAGAAWRAGLTAIICIGESEAQRDAGDANRVCGDQIDGSVPEGATAANTVIAYEPVWAIGTGRTPTPNQIAEVHAFLRARLADHIGAEAAKVRLLYGGSVKPSNAAEIFALPHVDGALVGGASLKAADFAPIVAALSAA
jgi:triosephosphate isomerase